MKNIFYFFSLAICVISSAAFAGEEYPTTGIVYNTKEDSSITYDCNKLSSGVLECDLVQTSVRKKAKIKDLPEKLLEAKKQLPDAIKEIASEESCELTAVILSVLEGKSTPEQAAENAPKGAISDKQQFIKGMNEISASKKDDLLASIAALNDFCETKSEKSFLNITKIEHEKAIRTCTVSSNPFKQTFKWVEDYSGKGAWVVDAKPSGSCGIVQLDRFEADVTNSKLVFWKYIAKKAITNPKGEMLLSGLTCGNLDQDEYPYDWKSERDTKLGCEYIEFSPIW
jgi:hypothetical protein